MLSSTQYSTVDMRQAVLARQYWAACYGRKPLSEVNQRLDTKQACHPLGIHTISVAKGLCMLLTGVKRRSSFRTILTFKAAAENVSIVQAMSVPELRGRL